MSVDKIDSEFLKLDINDNVATITINRPDRMNAYTPKMAGEIIRTVNELDDNGVRALVLTGTGQDAFCGGFDIQAYLNMSDDDSGTEAALVASTRKTQRVVKTLRGASLPVVAAVNGYALGGGMDISLACDMRVAKRGAEFAQSYVNVGLVPDAGAYLLPRLVGEARAKELIASGNRLDAPEAKDIGLVAEIIDGDAEATCRAARERATNLADGPTVAIGVAKQLVNESFEVSLETALDHALEGERICHKTDDHHEAVEAFIEDREPMFTGS